MNNKKIGIVTFHRAYNFGAALQAYALQEELHNSGNDSYRVAIVDYTPSCISNRYRLIKIDLSSTLSIIKSFINSILNLPFIYYKKRLFNYFIDKYFLLGSDNIDKYNIAVCGSDQIWNPSLTKGVNPFYYAESNYSGLVKISYAASFGISSIPELYRDSIKSSLLKFSKLSLREIDGVKILEDELDISGAEVVLDPCFFLNAKQWMDIARKYKGKKKYIVIYQFIQNNKLIQDAKEYARLNSCNIVELTVSYGKNLLRLNSTYSIVVAAGPADFLGIIMNAEFVFTNSFHGSVFSMIFGKQFYSYPFSDRSSRLLSLLKQVDLEDRFITTQECGFSKIIEYADVNNKLESLISKSRQFLHDSVASSL
ncbi:MAG TPA: polysaccharide pyruvyl transferase family protein [Acholeplasmataceae bacterium]|nr:polysaccharide pyruvyl transferase family protein [Acholeplasmataceae bacterium]